MNKTVLITIISCFFLSSLAEGFAQPKRVQKPSLGPKGETLYEKIDRLTKTKGQYIEKEGVYKVGFPRSDLMPEIAGVKLPPSMGLGVWAAFKITAEGQAMVMGDTVLTQDQVNPVLNVALDNGLEVTAIHNHFLWDSPKIMFMHISASGDIEKLATSVGNLFSRIQETARIKTDMPYADIDTSQTTLDPRKIEEIMGKKGEITGGVYKITIGRMTSMSGIELGNAMGINTWAAFAGTDQKALVDGDFVMLEQEVQPVLKALRKAGINITALHNHMMGEYPRTMFLHFWGVGPTTELAKGLKAALNTQNPGPLK